MPKNGTRSKSHKGKTKVKSGCRTCKIRKVKCDEGRPACERCITTGRACDGYGIWGGGGNSYGNQQRLVNKDGTADPHLSISFSVLSSGTAEEKSYFEIFKCKTSIKLPGSFVSKFWNTLVFQSSYSEPAVLHAVLALSSAHQNEDTKIKEQFTLHQYLKAINHLQPHFSGKDRGSTRIALITCILFVCLEFLRGHFATAQIHLQNGLQVLSEMGIVTDELEQALSLSPRNKSTEDWIVEAFSRLHLQLELFKYGYQHPSLAWQTTERDLKSSQFHSIDEAWRGLGSLFNKTFQLTHQCRQQEAFIGEGCSNNSALLSQQLNILTSLENWHKTFKASAINILNRKPHEGAPAFQLLNSYHTLCLIMTSTSLHPASESIFDIQLANFQLLISQLETIREISSEHLLQEELLDMPRSIIDMGWIPLLYFTATKCRDHWIRRKAVNLLESGSHREGIWDSRITTCVARKVVEMEERDFYTVFDFNERLSLRGDLYPRDLELPILPFSYRLREVEMVLLGSPMDRILLFGKEEREGVDRRVLLSEYDVGSQSWTDKRSLGSGE